MANTLDNSQLDEEIGRLEFTKFSLVNAAISLIPIFPTWTLFPGVILGSTLGDAIGNCEQGYEIILWVSSALTIVSIGWYCIGVDRIIAQRNRKQLRIHFRVFSLVVYTLLNTVFLIELLGTKLACHGDGQTLLVCIVTGPMASVAIVIMGFLLDLKKGG